MEELNILFYSGMFIDSQQIWNTIQALPATYGFI